MGHKVTLLPGVLVDGWCSGCERLLSLSAAWTVHCMAADEEASHEVVFLLRALLLQHLPSCLQDSLEEGKVDEERGTGF